MPETLKQWNIKYPNYVIKYIFGTNLYVIHGIQRNTPEYYDLISITDIRLYRFIANSVWMQSI